MALHRAKRRRMEFEGSEPELSVAGTQPSSSNFSSSKYLMQHGWQGAGVPLDGKEGKGLKKPLAIPQKRDVKGIGKNRDRAVEWWDSIFEASAKTLSIGPQSNTASSSSPSPVPSTDLPTARKNAGSLHAAARREHARKLLMSSFIRGEIIGQEVKLEVTREKVGNAEEVPKRSSADETEPSQVDHDEARQPNSKEQRRIEKAAKAARKKARAEKRALKEAKRGERKDNDKDAKRSKKAKVSKASKPSSASPASATPTTQEASAARKAKRRKDSA